MNRQLLWVLMVVSMCAGCAARPASDGQALAAKIVNQRPWIISCGAGEERVCEADVDGQQRCGCVHHLELFGPQ